MARNPRRIDAQLEALYAQVPAMLDCKGLCADSCGPIECSIRERERVERESGRKLEAASGCLDCSMLTPMGRCGVYEHRPMICRLWGTTEGMICPHGCTPERVLPREESWDLLAAAMVVGGNPWPGLSPAEALTRGGLRTIDEAIRSTIKEDR